MVHRYGPHIFNTSNDEVWSYVNRFGEFSSVCEPCEGCNLERCLFDPYQFTDHQPIFRQGNESR